MYYRNILICSAASNSEEIIEVSDELHQRMKGQSKQMVKHEIMASIKELSALEAALRWSTHPRILLELALIKLCEGNVDKGDAGLSHRIEAVEKKIDSITSNGLVSGIKTSGTSSPVLDATSKRDGKAVVTARSSANTAANVEGLNFWDDILKELKQNGRMVLYTNLLDTKIIRVDEKVVGIVFKSGSSFGKMSVSKAENMEVIQSYIEARLGKEIRIKCLDDDDVIDNNKNKLGEDKFIEKAQDLAAKLNTTLNIIDE
jgi:DNA polymerase-3 subunit gamma/tau